MSISADAIKLLQEKVWQGSIPLHITLSPTDCNADTLPYLIQCPRLSYLPSLLPRLHSFFAPVINKSDVAAHQGWFSVEDVPLKWQQSVGLLYDVFSGAEPVTPHSEIPRYAKPPNDPDDNDSVGAVLPWKLVIHFSEWPLDTLIPLDAEGKTYHDSFMNSVKEADFLRNGTAKTIMSLSKDDSTRLWDSVQNHSLSQYNSIFQKLLNPADGAALRHVPLKVYLPAAPDMTVEEETAQSQVKGKLKVAQCLVPPMLSSREVQTLGTALHGFLPTLFPSRRSYIFAQAVLHGAVVPPAAPIEQLMKGAAYADGFLHISVVMMA